MRITVHNCRAEHSTAQNSSDNLLSYPSNTLDCLGVVYWRGGDDYDEGEEMRDLYFSIDWLIAWLIVALARRSSSSYRATRCRYFYASSCYWMLASSSLKYCSTSTPSKVLVVVDSRVTFFFLIISLDVAWLSGNGVRHINEVTVRRARLVVGWVTVHRYAVLICNQPLRQTEPPNLNEMGNEYWPRSSGSSLQPGR